MEYDDNIQHNTKLSELTKFGSIVACGQTYKCDEADRGNLQLLVGNLPEITCPYKRTVTNRARPRSQFQKRRAYRVPSGNGKCLTQYVAAWCTILLTLRAKFWGSTITGCLRPLTAKILFRQQRWNGLPSYEFLTINYVTY